MVILMSIAGSISLVTESSTVEAASFGMVACSSSSARDASHDISASLNGIIIS